MTMHLFKAAIVRANIRTWEMSDPVLPSDYRGIHAVVQTPCVRMNERGDRTYNVDDLRHDDWSCRSEESRFACLPELGHKDRALIL